MYVFSRNRESMSEPKGCCGCPFIPDQPCGCPPGTVRSFLAIFSTIVILLGLIALIIILIINQQWALAGTVSNGPTAILSAIISYYFASRQKPKNEQSHPEDENFIISHNHTRDDSVEVIGGNNSR
jgi:hypothetical protein